MTDDELFVCSLKKIKEQMAEERCEITRTDELNSQIAAEYDDGLKILTKAVKKIKEIDDLWSLDEEDFIYVLTCFEQYSESFIIDGRNPEQQKKDEEEFERLQDILMNFYEEDDDCDEDEELSDDETEE